MPGNLEQFVKTTLQKEITASYPHLKLPAILAAVITTAQRLDNGWSEYSLLLVDAGGTPDPAYPEIPNIRARLAVEQGATVAVGMLFGMLEPAILCEVQL